MKKRKKEVIVKVWGGLGNQLFIYAFARKMVEEGYQVYLDMQSFFQDGGELIETPREYLLEVFNIKIPCKKMDVQIYKRILTNRLFYGKFIRKILCRLGFYLKYSFENEPTTYIDQLLDLHHGSYVEGYFQNERYFKSIRTILLKELCLKKKLDLPTELYRKNTVSIHIRRSDYVKSKTFMPCSVDYYLAAIDYMKEKIKTPFFCFFTDDIDWLKRSKLLKDIDYVCISEEYTYKDYEELILMSKCENNIIANSTFSWWGAWLNENKDKIVVAPSKWFISKKEGGIVPNEWVRI